VIKTKLTSKDLIFVVRRDIPGQAGQLALYFTATTVTNSTFLVELKLKAGMNVCKVAVRSPNKTLSELCKLTVARLVL
jgi:hypothetical protein